MIIGTCLIELHLKGNDSLKGKRGLLKPLLARLHKEFNVSAAEVDHLDSWQAASIALACVANDAAHVEQVLNNAVHWIEHNRPDLQVVDWQVEIL
jgi:uncharacterized protein YlxP (DUF503 family)